MASCKALPKHAGILLLGGVSAIAAGCSSESPSGAVTQEAGNTPPATAPAEEAAPQSSNSATSDAPTPSNQPRLVDKTFDDIKFEIEPDAPFSREMLTDEIEALVGQRIRIRGYILPTFQRKGIRQFVLVRDDQECCFGPGAALYDCIIVEMQPGQSTEFTVKPVAVEGEFSVKELIGPEGNHLAIYHMAGEAVK